MPDWSKSFWRGAFSDPDGTPSFARVASGVVVVAAVSWVTAVIVMQHSLPTFEGVSAFLVAALASLYGTNKITSIFEKKP